jgi:hypothetical protein
LVSFESFVTQQGHVPFEARLTAVSCPLCPVLRPFMMPIFFYGGQISKALESASINAAQQVALTEIRSLLAWLVMQLGVVTREQADVMLRFTPLARPSTLDHRAGEAPGSCTAGSTLCMQKTGAPGDPGSVTVISKICLSWQAELLTTSA